MKKLFMTKDVSYYSLYSLFTSMVFETPIFFMYLANKGLEYSKITLLFSINALAVFVFEYVTGVFADKYSRKGILIFSGISLVLGEISFILGNNYYHFILGILLISLSTASRSGADTALIFDKLVEINKKEDFDDIMSSLGSLMLIISAAVVIIGPFLTKYGMYIPFLGTIIFYILSILILANIKEPYIENKEISAKVIIKKSVNTAINNKTVMGYIFLSIIIFPCFHILIWLFQPYLKSSQINIEYFGIFYTLLTVFQSLGTKLSGYLNKNYNSGKIMIISSIMIFIGFLLMSLNSNMLVYLIPIVLGVSFGIYYTTNTIVINKLIDSEIRASLLSLQHALTKILQMILFALMALSIERYPLRNSFLYLSIYLIVSLSVIYIFFRKNFISNNQYLDNALEEN